MFFTARNIFHAATMSALFVAQYCQVHFSGEGLVVLESTCSAPWVLSILPNQPVRNQWNYQEKMERHFSVKQSFQENQATIYSSTEILTTFWQSRTGNENFWKWNGKDRPVKEDHLWRWTTLTGKFPCWPKRSIYFSSEISENFGIMISPPI